MRKGHPVNSSLTGNSGQEAGDSRPGPDIMTPRCDTDQRTQPYTLGFNPVEIQRTARTGAGRIDVGVLNVECGAGRRGR
ncbi:Hypothetical protein DEACI_4007 [Acididesulfobacillus acetoxydans]|uniref:Uncharacterized protein n=1 Tax=Acididesulfobacillus acetoxydans TaxID=1561005 RepID=A0A8S0WRB0_9FIRM|nr:Hypothetical protein DEACI_4007 [Acididesulfobacillus acetoxydans]CEJ07588.1 Hypothetical protein DEACI_2054 [Acididesulfobacillus acetoxydans]